MDSRDSARSARSKARRIAILTFAFFGICGLIAANMDGDFDMLIFAFFAVFGAFFSVFVAVFLILIFQRVADTDSVSRKLRKGLYLRLHAEHLHI